MAPQPPRTPSPHGSVGSVDAPHAPLWGPRHDDQDMPIARRSKRSTSNPFRTANEGKISTPEHRAQQDGITPPSPPASPSVRAGMSTPKHTKTKKTARFVQDHLSTASQVDSHALMLTPVKTPRKSTPPSTGASRTVVFQHGDVSDAMPAARKLKNATKGGKNIFAAYKANGASFEIHTDWNAKQPTLDLSEDNAFIGERAGSTKAKSRLRQASPLPLTSHMSEEEMAARVSNDEGLIFTMRGRKVFRPYEDSLANVAEAESLGYKPLKRSNARPVLLDFGRLAGGANDTDEEAVTDIEAGDEDLDVKASMSVPQSSMAEHKEPDTRSAFTTWSLTKPDSAKGIRKREVEEQGPSQDTKKARSLA